MRHHRILFSLTIAALCTTASPAHANDSTASIGLGGVVLLKQADIAMEAEDLQIGLDRIDVAYRFRNRSDRDIETTVAFPLPRISLITPYYEDQSWPHQDSDNLINFLVTVDGVPVPTTEETRAYLKETDVTGELRALGVVLGRPMDWKLEIKDAAPLGPRFLAPLENQEPWLTWEEQTTFHWPQRFAAGKPTRIEHRYAPAAGHQHFSGDGDLAKYCFDRQDETEIRRLAALDRADPRGEGGNFAQIATVDYILTTANNWRGPIGDFSLTLTASSPMMMIASCFPGLERKDGNARVLHRHDFSPKSELRVFFLMPNRR